MADLDLLVDKVVILVEPRVGLGYEVRVFPLSR